MRPNLSFADVQFRHQMKERFSIMKNNITELVFILDRSGSMSGLEGDTIGGFNSMIEKQKKQDGGCYVSTVLFDDESEVLHDIFILPPSMATNTPHSSSTVLR